MNMHNLTALVKRVLLFIAGFYVVADGLVLIMAGIHGTGPFLFQHLYEGPAVLLLFVPLTLQWLFVPAATQVGLEALGILILLVIAIAFFERGGARTGRETSLFYFLALPAVLLVLIEMIPTLFG